MHHLEPRAASTWSDLTTEATATRSALPVNAALPPAAYPYDDRARVRSDVLYAVGGDAQELVPSAPTDELQAAWQVRCCSHPRRACSSFTNRAARIHWACASRTPRGRVWMPHCRSRACAHPFPRTAVFV
ncbi:MAG: hypothetical protein EOO41_00410 [Methanobacteriota archaeon]|nr:MAG: hypothetical protein EOO41_00410 [Euryarchaeota archaeon]